MLSGMYFCCGPCSIITVIPGGISMIHCKLFIRSFVHLLNTLLFLTVHYIWNACKPSHYTSFSLWSSGWLDWCTLLKSTTHNLNHSTVILALAYI